jgi:hypothetical protein
MPRRPPDVAGLNAHLTSERFPAREGVLARRAARLLLSTDGTDFRAILFVGVALARGRTTLCAATSLCWA